MLTLLFNRAGAGKIRPDGKRVVARDVARKPVLGHDKILDCCRHWRANLFFSRAYKLFPSADAAKTSYSLKIRCRFAVQPALIPEALAALYDRLIAVLNELSPLARRQALEKENKLTATDAQLIEGPFRVRLMALAAGVTPQLPLAFQPAVA
jgi:hypothetical protein